MTAALAERAREAPLWLWVWCMCLFLLPFKQVFPGPAFVALQFAAVGLCLLHRGPKANASNDRVVLLSGMMVIICLSYFHSISRADTEMPLLRVAVAYLCYLALTSARLASHELDLVLRAWMWGGIAVAVMTIRSYVALGVDEEGRAMMMVGDVGSDPNFLMSELLMPFAIAFFLVGRSSRRWEAVLAIGLIGFTAFLCQSRGGVIAMLLVGIALLVSAHRWKTLAVTAMVAVSLYLVGGESLGRFHLGEDTTGSQRTVVWGILLPIGVDHWVTGVGLDASRAATRSAPGFYRELEPHNTYIQAFVETGLPGLLLFLTLFGLHLRLKGPHGAMPALRAGLWGLAGAGLFLHLLAYQNLWISWAVIAQAAAARPSSSQPTASRQKVRAEAAPAPLSISQGCQQA